MKLLLTTALLFIHIIGYGQYSLEPSSSPELPEKVSQVELNPEEDRKPASLASEALRKAGTYGIIEIAASTVFTALGVANEEPIFVIGGGVIGIGCLAQSFGTIIEAGHHVSRLD